MGARLPTASPAFEVAVICMTVTRQRVFASRYIAIETARVFLKTSLANNAPMASCTGDTILRDLGGGHLVTTALRELSRALPPPTLDRSPPTAEVVQVGLCEIMARWLRKVVVRRKIQPASVAFFVTFFPLRCFVLLHLERSGYLKSAGRGWPLFLCFDRTGTHKIYLGVK